MAPFYGWGSTASRLEPLQGDSLRLTTKFPEIPVTHFIDLGICSRNKVSLTWDLKPIPLDLCSDACSTELASPAQKRYSTVNVYTRSNIKEHQVVPECWQLSRSELHLR